MSSTPGRTDSVSVYIHIPFCKRKCGYCDFNSYPGMEEEYDRYLQAVIRELEYRGREFFGAAAPSVFFGGGTPSMMGAGRLRRILDRCASIFSVDSEAEVSVEANPETLKSPLTADLRAAGFNRISIGVQSFDDDYLKLLGRTHSEREASEAISEARHAGFENVSLDLIYALPGQNLAQWEEDVASAVSLKPQHISAYELKVEENTPFECLLKSGDLHIPDDDLGCLMYDTSSRKLIDAGYRHYEISNFALPGRRCLHNLNYWKNGQYLGFGAGAHSHINGERFSNILHPIEYAASVMEQGHAVGFRESLTPRAALGEALILGLRLEEGIDVEDYSRRYCIPLLDEYASVIEELTRMGLLERNGPRMRLTSRGYLLSDEVFVRFL